MTAADVVGTFDAAGPLPEGRLLVEASAGTGKTHAVTGLVVRELAAGRVAADQLLVMTFTLSAAGELRQRLRRGLVAAVDVLEGRADLDALPDDDPLAIVLAEGHEPGDVLVRVRAALRDLEQALVGTIDAFAHRALGVLGTRAAHDPDLELVDDDRELVETVVRDVLVRARGDGRWDADTSSPRIGEVVASVELLLADPTARPAPDDPLRDLLVDATERVEARRRAVRRTTHGDVLRRLLEAVDGDETACRVLRERHRLVVVDESQDTSPLQWAILDAVFGGDARTVVVGDPKQSIYRFRGADVDNHVRARATADERRALTTCWRADGDLLDGLARLWTPAGFGDADISWTPVRPRPTAPPTALAGDDGAAVELRCHVEVERHPRHGHGELPSDVVADLVRTCAELLADGLTLPVDHDTHDPHDAADRGTAGRRPLAPDDLAVLVGTNAQARDVRDALVAAGLDAMVDGVGSVLDTEAAGWWRLLLDALASPADVDAARWAALTPLYGLSLDELAADDVALGSGRRTEAVDQLHDDLHAWGALLRDRGVAALLRALVDQRHAPARVRRRPDGRRAWVDVQHVADLLHDAQRAQRLGPEGLAAWLADAREGDVGVARREAFERRLETEDPAIRISTVHRSKGREHPVVLLPFAARVPAARSDTATSRAPDGGRLVHLRGAPGHASAHGGDKDLLRDELWRLLYVAMTRAQHRVIAWWAPFSGSARAPLSQLLFPARADGSTRAKGDLGRGRALDELLLPHLRDGDAALRVVAMPPAATTDTPSATAGDDRPVPGPIADGLAAASWPAGRRADDGWRRTSYTGLKKLLHAGPAAIDRAPEARVDVRLDEEDAPDTTDRQAPRPRRSPGVIAAPSIALPLADVVGGPELGTLAHEALERVDFTSPRLVDDLVEIVTTLQRRRAVAVDPSVLARGLAAAIDTPLGAIAGGRALRGVARRDRLDELEVALPLAGGWHARHGRLGLRDVRNVLQDHAADDPVLAAYVAHLAAHSRLPAAIHGELTGAVDLVVRLRDEDAPDRYLVVDHKTNRLGDGGPLVLADYHPDRLLDAMVRGDYVLQALLYLVATHRFLRWRLGDDHVPARDLAGVAWTFLRGMVGHEAPVLDDGRAHGVFAWTPAVALVEDLDALLGQGRRRDEGAAR